MKIREIAREKALQILYEKDITMKDLEVILKNFDFDNAPEDSIIYAISICKGVEDNINNLDEIIKEHLIDWEWDRILYIDKNILRIATYELIYKNDIPTAVIIDQAVRISKKFGSFNDSYKFINGILGRIAEKFRNEKKT
ncbi:MAG: transcription antitermination factor NusB [Caldisericia bacterium]